MADSDAGRWRHQPNNGKALWAAATAVLLLLGFRRPPFAGNGRAAAGPIPEKGQPSDGGGRGHRASTPGRIGLNDVKDILLSVYGNIGEHRVVSIAAGVTFYALLAIVPAIAAQVSLYGLFADPATISSQLDNFSGVLPGGAVDVIRDQLNRVVSQHTGTLSLTFLSSLAVSIWSANAGMKALFDALNLVHGEKERRGLIALNLQTLLFTSGAILFLITAIGLLVALPPLLEALGLAGATGTLVLVARWAGLLVAIAVGLALLFRFGPSRATPRWRWITVGSCVAALAWLGASLLFSWYAANFGSYNATYGSLGAVIGFMVWMWISTIVILLGAELDAAMEHETVRDTPTH